MGEQKGYVHVEPDPLTCASYRMKQALVMMVGFFFVFGLRVNISIAMVCMVRPLNTTQRNLTDFHVCEGDRSPSAPPSSEGAEFDWDAVTQGWIFSSFYMGYILTQIVGGIIAPKLGTKLVLSIAMIIAGLSTFLTPEATRAGGPGAMIALRVITGLAMGVAYPANMHFWARWSPVYERTKLVVLATQGSTIGVILTFVSSGILCAVFGWPSIYYVFATLCFLWVFLSLFHLYDTPSQHPRITGKERIFIEASVGKYKDHEKTVLKGVPWKKMMTSPPFLALIVVGITSNWTIANITTVGPTYLREILQLQPVVIGLFAGLLGLLIVISAIIFSIIADIIRRTGVLSTTNTRKVFYLAGTVPSAIFAIILGFLDCRNRNLAMALLSLSAISAGGSYTVQVNVLDIAPRYAGILRGIMNTFATIPAIVAPVVIRYITRDGTRPQWQMAYILGAIIGMVGMLVFVIFGQGEVQEWAKEPEDDMELITNPTTKEEKDKENNYEKLGRVNEGLENENGEYAMLASGASSLQAPAHLGPSHI